MKIIENDEKIQKTFKKYLIAMMILLFALPSFFSSQHYSFYLHIGTGACYGNGTVIFFIFPWAFFSRYNFNGSMSFFRPIYLEYDHFCKQWIYREFPAVPLIFVISLVIAVISLIIFIKSLRALKSNPTKGLKMMKPVGIYSLLTGASCLLISFFLMPPFPNSGSGMMMLVFGILIVYKHKVHFHESTLGNDGLFSTFIEQNSLPLLDFSSNIQKIEDNVIVKGKMESIDFVQNVAGSRTSSKTFTTDTLARKPGSVSKGGHRQGNFRFDSNQIYQVIVKLDKLLQNIGSSIPIQELAKRLGFASSDVKLLLKFIVDQDKNLIWTNGNDVYFGKNFTKEQKAEYLQLFGRFLRNITR
ncbi:MAG: hypothetical protein ACTSXU_14385 [Promethearchaeota archaeon]